MAGTDMTYVRETLAVLAKEYGMSTGAVADAIGAGESTVRGWVLALSNASHGASYKLERLLEYCEKYGAPERKRRPRYIPKQKSA